jgi:hypothetical protein
MPTTPVHCISSAPHCSHLEKERVKHTAPTTFQVNSPAAYFLYAPNPNAALNPTTAIAFPTTTGLSSFWPNHFFPFFASFFAFSLAFISFS